MAHSMEHAATAQRRRPPKILYKVMNPTFKAILRSPLHRWLSRRLLLLTFTGRKSGTRYRIPLGYVQEGSTLWLATASRWAANLHGGVPVSVRLRGQERAGTADVITDEQGMWEGFRTMFAATPELSSITGIRIDADGLPNREDVTRARRDNFVVIKIQLG